MVLIVTSFGATKNYPDKEMMKKTFNAFLNSLRRQTNKNFKLFISHHDRPWVSRHDDFIVWCDVADGMEATCVPKKLPEKPIETIEFQSVPYNCKMTDMSRKTYNSVIWAGKYAFQHNLDKFWMLRMDSDDMLAKDMVERLNSLDTEEIKAIYNRQCHIFDVKNKEIAEQYLLYSSTCNALFMEIKGDELPNWYYHCNDHTKFASMVIQDDIPSEEWDWTLCISTNSGNHISDRTGIGSYDNIRKVKLTEDLIDRYGLKSIL